MVVIFSIDTTKAKRRSWSGLYTLDCEFVSGMAKRRSVRVTVNFKEIRKGQGTPFDLSQRKKRKNRR